MITDETVAICRILNFFSLLMLELARTTIVEANVIKKAVTKTLTVEL